MEAEVWKSNEWAESVKFYVRRHLYLNRVSSHIDWDDIIQECLIRCWDKREGYDPSKPFKPWLKTVCLNHAKNEVRNRYVRMRYPRQEGRFSKWSFNNPIPLTTKIREISEDGVEEVVYQPDIADPRTTESIRESLSVTDLGRLTGAQKSVLLALLNKPRPIDHGGKGLYLRKMKQADRAKVRRLYQARVKLKRMYRNALDRRDA